VPRLAHLLGARDHYCPHVGAIRRHLRARQLTGPPARRQPLGGRLLNAVVLNQNRATEANHEVPTEQVQHFVKNLVAEAAIGQQGDIHLRRDGRVNLLDECLLNRGPLARKLRPLHRLPRQRRRSTVPRNHVHAERGMVVRTEVGPVESEQRLIASAQNEARPLWTKLIDIDPPVAQESVELFDAVLRLDLRHLRVRRADHMDPHAHRLHRRCRVVGQCVEPLAVHVLEDLSHHAAEPLSAEGSAATPYQTAPPMATAATPVLHPRPVHAGQTPVNTGKFRGDPSGSIQLKRDSSQKKVGQPTSICLEITRILAHLRDPAPVI
jgi:hypothetical protein